MFKNIGLKHFYGDFFDSRFYVSHLLLKNKSKNMLDIGCGLGVILHAAPNCFKIGTDISFESLKDAKKLNKNIEYVQSDAQFLPFKDDFFTTITAMHLFPVINNMGGNWKLSINEVKRIAAKKSIIFITGANRPSRHFGKTHPLKHRKNYLKHTEQVTEFEDKFDVSLEGYGPHSRFLMFPFKIMYKIPDSVSEKLCIEKLLFWFTKSKKYLKNGRSYVIICRTIN
jgi:ubiquinone/menaquinone biosynthesis C-methylase UbiE